MAVALDADGKLCLFCKETINANTSDPGQRPQKVNSTEFGNGWAHISCFKAAEEDVREKNRELKLRGRKPRDPVTKPKGGAL